MKKATGLVLSGGGAKGAYEIGVYKALCEHGIDRYIGAFSGTSVGALNAVLLECMGKDAEQVWQELKFTDLVNPDRSRMKRIAESLLGMNTVPSSSDTGSSVYSQVSDLVAEGLPFTQERISQLIDRYIDFDKLQRDIYIMCLRVRRTFLAPTDRKAECFHLNRPYPWYDDEQKKQIILASSAIPGFFCGAEGVRIKGHDGMYFDGGYSENGDNTPIFCLYEKGFRKIIAVHLENYADISDQKLYSGAKIVNIVPSEDLGGMISGTLNLNSEKIAHDIELGYKDATDRMDELISLMNDNT